MMHAPEWEYPLGKDLMLRLRDLQRPARTGIAKWNVRQIFGLVAIGIALIWLLPHLPNRFFTPDEMHLTITLGVLERCRLVGGFPMACAQKSTAASSLLRCVHARVWCAPNGCSGLIFSALWAGVHSVLGPVFMRPFGFPSLALQICSALSFRVKNAA